MLTISKPITEQQGRNYYKTEYTVGDYYTDDSSGKIIGRWFGGGAEKMGLGDNVKEEQFKNLLAGLDPTGKKQLTFSSNNHKSRRAAFDLCFSANKAVSLLGLVGQNDKVVEAHEKAVRKALAYLEKEVETRNTSGKTINSSNFLIAQFQHQTTRVPQGQDFPDPHLHTHCVAINMTFAEGKWRAIEPKKLYQAQKLATAIYQSELMHSLKYDLNINVDPLRKDALKNGGFKIPGISKDDIMNNSGRERDILEEISKSGGVDTHEERLDIQRATKTKKGEYNNQEIIKKWQDKNNSIDFEEISKGDKGQIIQRDSERAAKEAIDYSVKHLTATKTVFSKSDLLTEALVGWQSEELLIDEIEAEIKKRVKNRSLLIATTDEGKSGFTTEKALSEEEYIINQAIDGKGKYNGKRENTYTEDEIDQWARNIMLPDGTRVALGEEQIQASKVILRQRDQFVALEGKAGVGKSFALKNIADKLRNVGFEVRGFAPTGSATKELDDAGIESKTVSSLIQSNMRSDKPMVWFVDEAGMVGRNQMYQLFKKAIAANAKVVLVGDPDQHKAVEAGTPFYMLTKSNDRGIQTVAVTEIRRQDKFIIGDERDVDESKFLDEAGYITDKLGKRTANPIYKAVMEASQRETEKSIETLHKAGFVHQIPDREERHKKMVDSIAKDLKNGKDVLTVTPANRDRIDINNKIRAAIGLSGTGHDYNVYNNQNISDAERTRAKKYNIGDIIRYNRGQKDGPLAMGMEAKVIGVNARLNHLTVEYKDIDGKPQIYKYNPNRLFGVDVFREDKREFAVGDRVQFTEPDREAGITRRSRAVIYDIDDETKEISLKMDAPDGRSFKLNASKARFLDHGYTMTSYSSQGKTVDKVVVNIDSSHNKELVNLNQYYVSISRARFEAQIFTDDKERLPASIRREQDMLNATEALKKENSNDSQKSK